MERLAETFARAALLGFALGMIWARTILQERLERRLRARYEKRKAAHKGGGRSGWKF